MVPVIVMANVFVTRITMDLVAKVSVVSYVVSVLIKYYDKIG